MHVEGHDTGGTEAQRSRTPAPARRERSAAGGEAPASTRAQEVGRLPRILAAGGPTTHGHLLGLQRTAGNRAVALAVQQSRGEQPQETDAGVGDVLRSPGRPLNPNVREDMESRLGADFSGVQVHTGADAQRSARDLGARAYTSGDHVVLGEGGGDQHTLAHELVHVVQQRQGPVAGTDTGTGLRVSDPGDRFEREAEATAHRVMAGAPAHGHGDPHEDARSHSHAAGQVPVQREVAAQIVAAEQNEGEGLRVDRLIISGRPESPHTDTMGDHTTASVVLISAVNRVIKGKTAEEAAQGVWGLFEESNGLPGAELRENLSSESRQARLLDAAEAELMRLYGLGDGEQWDMLRLQQLIGQYLQFREALPLTTLNIKKTGQKHGKSTGEGWRVGPLNRHEAGEENLSAEAIKENVRHLLDHDALLTYAINRETRGSVMAPGTEDDGTTDEATGEWRPKPVADTFDSRLRPIVTQHVVSVRQAFPTAFEVAWSDQKKAEDELMTGLEVRLKEAKKKEVASYTDRLKKMRKGGNKKDAEQTEQLLRALGVEPPEEPNKKYGRGMRRAEDKVDEDASEPPATPKKRETAKELFSGLTNSPFMKKARDPFTSRSKKSDETDAESEIATQLVFGDDGMIDRMLLQGRAAKRFNGSHGAHTTAWVTHVDFIRARLVGKDVTAAVGELDGLVGHVRQVEKNLASFRKTSLNDRMRSMRISGRAGEETPATAQALSALDATAVHAAMTDRVKAAKDAANQSAVAQALLLQQAVGAILERINIIPGIALEATDTSGQGEGTYRTMLRTGKKGTQQIAMQRNDYRTAIFGLLGMKDVNSKQQLDLMQNHLYMIREAYLGALDKADLSEDEPAVALGGWKKAKQAKEIE